MRPAAGSRRGDAPGTREGGEKGNAAKNTGNVIEM